MIRFAIPLLAALMIAPTLVTAQEQRGVADLLLTVRQTNNRLFFREQDLRDDIANVLDEQGATFGGCDEDVNGTCWYYLSNNMLVGYQVDIPQREVRIYGYDDSHRVLKALNNKQVSVTAAAVRDALRRRYQSVIVLEPTD
ncbi:hypothetical protein OAS86_00030 [Gammaproteobacteria bacterium]|nr:hypothetical protein [Gammaproteobacteria bacterium]